MSILLLPHNAFVAPSHVPVFSKIKPQVLNIAKHLKETGLLRPILVKSHKHTKHGIKYKIIDGAKRLNAILYLKAVGQLPLSLEKIPCIEQSESETQAEVATLCLMSESELASHIRQDFDLGRSKAEIMTRYDCSANIIDKAMSLEFLHPKIMAAFNRCDLTLSQAAAFAAFPNPDAQWRLLQQLGPFADSAEILSSLEAGDATLSLPNGDVLILPSRKLPPLNQFIEMQYAA